MKTVKITTALVILVVLFIFSVYNSQTVEIAFLGYRSPALPLFLIILFMFLLGGILVGLLAAIGFSQLHRRNQLLRREIDARSKHPGARLDSPSEMKTAPAVAENRE